MCNSLRSLFILTTLGWLIVLLGISSNSYAGISATPKFLFLDGTKRSVPIYITNSGDAEREVWVEAKYGYITTDDSGKVSLFVDSLGVGEPSAVSWIKSYPQRFILGPGESQTIRLTATPPAGTELGEYWARVIISGKPRKPPKSVALESSTQSGLILVNQLDLPFHYRVGKVSTGLELGSIAPTLTDSTINVMMKITRKGNASFWGSRKIQLVDSNGKVVYSEKKNTICYKSFVINDIIGRKNLSPGTYTFNVEIMTGKRTDLNDNVLIQSLPIRSSTSIVIP